MLRDRTAFAGSLRNASAVAAAAQDAAAESIRKRIAVIAAGEHWPGGNLRPAIEDLLGAGAIIERLQGRPSPEARAARAAYRELKDEIPAVLDRKSTRLNSSHYCASRMPSSAGKKKQTKPTTNQQ